MFALDPSPSEPAKHLAPNLLPCRIHHSGPVPTSSRYWSPSTATAPNGVTKTKASYLRGRKLLGRTLRLPVGYTGLVLQKRDRLLPVKPKMPTAEELRAMEEGSDDGLADGAGIEEAEVKVLERKAEFDEVVVWGHEALAEGDDVYVKGVEEWVRFAEAIHCDDQSTATSDPDISMP